MSYSLNMKFVLLFLLGLASALVAQTDHKVLGKSTEESYEGKVVLIKVGEDDLVNGQSFKFWERILERVTDEKAKAVVFHLDTPGGLAFPTKELMSQIANLEVPTYSFIDPKAMSAGALIAISTDEIYMAPGALVGSAGLVAGNGMTIDDTMRAKIESFFDAHVRWITEKKGHRYEVIEAMMMIRDEARQIGSRVVGKGELLALNSKEAIEPMDEGTLFAVSEIDSVEELLKAKGLDQSLMIEATPTGFERFAWWVASVSGLLILVGLGAGYFELKTPGFGIGGIVAILVFSLFFFGNYLAGNMAGYELGAVFAVGILLIFVEIFVIPGFGVAGITGLMMVVGSLIFAMVDKVQWQNREWTTNGLVNALDGPGLHFAGGIAGSLVLLYFMMRYLPDMPLLRRVQLKEVLPAGNGMEEDVARIGLTARAYTDLRPAGKIELNGDLFDVTAEGKFVLRGESVRIIKEDGMGMVVVQTE